MLDADGTFPDYSAAPELREQVSAARDRVAELLLVVVGISGALGLVTNLLVELVHTGTLTSTEWLTLTAAAAFTLVLAVTATLRLRLSSRDLDEEIELALPLLVPTGTSTVPIELVEVSAYGAVTELGHAALAKLPADVNAALAVAARRIDRGATHTTPPLTLVPVSNTIDDAEDDDTAPSTSTPAITSDDPVLWFLQLVQLLVIAECLDESERLLGPQAVFHRGRWLRRRTPRLRNLTWPDLVATAGPSHPFMSLRDLPGVRQRTSIPAPARLTLTNVAEELATAKRRAASQRSRSRDERHDDVPLIPLVRIAAGRTGWLTINGVGRVSAHAVPRYAQPAAGLTTRVFLRNARDNDLRRRALEEEALALLRADGGVPRPGVRSPDVQHVQALVAGADDLATEHARAWRAVYRGARRPRVARVYLTLQGHFRIRLSGRGSIADQALYAWSTALARRVGGLDVDALMARLAARQQHVPQRRF